MDCALGDAACRRTRLVQSIRSVHGSNPPAKRTACALDFGLAHRLTIACCQPVVMTGFNSVEIRPVDQPKGFSTIQLVNFEALPAPRTRRAGR